MTQDSLTRAFDAAETPFRRGRIGLDYFEPIGTHLLRGRTIDKQDTPKSTRVAVVNERFAQKFFKDQDPIC